MIDEATGAEPRVISASIADPYVLLIRDDSSAVVVYMNKDHELEELEREDKTLVTTKWLTGRLYLDKSGVFAVGDATSDSKTTETVLAFLLSGTGTFYVSSPADMEDSN